MLTLAFNVQPVNAGWTGGTIYIRADGSIDPPGAPIITYDNITYTLTDNITITVSGDGIVVERDNIILDGARHILTYEGTVLSSGILLSGRHNVTIKNVEISAFHYGIYMTCWASNNNIISNDIRDVFYGILLEVSSNNQIASNNMMAECGVYLKCSSNNTLSKNNISGCVAVDLDLSSQNSISRNNMNGGIFLRDSFENILSENNLTASYWFSIELYSSSNNNIFRNNMMGNGQGGIHLVGSSSNNISGNNVVSNGGDGIAIENSESNILCGNNVTNNEYAGIYLYGSSNNSISENNVMNNNGGLILIDSSSNRVLQNIFVRDGMFVYNSYNNIVEDNVVNDRVLLYLEEETGGFDKVTRKEIPLVFTDHIGQVILVKCRNIIIENCNLSNTDVGVELWMTNNTGIINCIIQNSDLGLYAFNSHNNTVYNNTITNTFWEGMLLELSNNNRISKNTIMNNEFGMIVQSSNYNSIHNNNISCNKNGIGVVASSFNFIYENDMINNNIAVGLSSSDNNSIARNYVINSDFYTRIGIWFWYDSDNNTVCENDIINCTAWIRIYNSKDNIFYHNNFLEYGFIWMYDGSPNIWDDGYPSGGNYWSNYMGADLYNGPNQNISGSDGIGDTPYIIDGNNRDRYPLMKPWPSPQITVRVESSTGTGMVALTPSSGVLVNLVAISEEDLPAEGKPDLEFPHGFFAFNITGLKAGEEITVTIMLPSPLPADSQYWKCQDGEWYEIPLGSNDGDEIITITLKDGGLGDADNEANGVIVDPGAPGCPKPKPPVGGVIISPAESQNPTTPYSTTLTTLIMATVIAAIIAARKRLPVNHLSSKKKA